MFSLDLIYYVLSPGSRSKSESHIAHHSHGHETHSSSLRKACETSHPIALPYCHVMDRNFCQSKFRHTVLFPPTHILEDIFTSCGLVSVYTVGSNADLTRFLIVMSNQTNKSNGMGEYTPYHFLDYYSVEIAIHRDIPHRPLHSRHYRHILASPVRASKF